MAVHDRVYMREEGPPRPRRRVPVAGWIVLLHAAAMLAVRGARVWYGRDLERLTYFGVGPLREGNWWTVATHVLVDRFSLAWFAAAAVLWCCAGVVEDLLGVARFLQFLAVAALASCLFHAAGVLSGVGAGVAPDASFGMSALTTACVVFAVLRDPRREVWTGVGGVPVRLLAGLWGLAGVAIVFGWFPIPGVGLWSQLGGAAWGVVAARTGAVPDVGAWFRRLARRGPRPVAAAAPPRPPRPATPPTTPADERARVDILLDKIAEQGMDALTPDERAFLERASRRY